MDHYLPGDLAEAREAFQRIVDDHVLIIRAELDTFVRRPMMGALVMLREATVGPSGDCTEKGRLRPIGNVNGATHITLERRLNMLGNLVERACDDYQAHTGIDPRTTSTDWVGQRIGMTLFALDMAVERLQAQAVFGGRCQADSSAYTLAELLLEPEDDAMERHRVRRT